MTDDTRLADLGERVARLEAEAAYLDRAVRDVPEVAAAAGRQGAISYEEGLRASFIETTRKELHALTMSLTWIKYSVFALVCAVAAMGTVIGVKLQVLVPMVP